MALSSQLPSHAAEPPAEITLKECLAVPSVGRSGRNALHQDALEARIVAGQWSPPQAGDTVTLPNGSTRQWERVSVNEEGVLRGRALAGGYVYWPVESSARRVLLLEAAGHNMVYVNGEPRMGDPFSTGYVRLPVLLRAGRNDLLFQCGRGQLRARLVEPTAPVVINPADPTMPDLVLGERGPVWGAVVVVNATEKPQERLALRAAEPASGAPVLVTPLPAIPPLSARKVGFRMRGRSPLQPGPLKMELKLLNRAGGRTETLDTATVDLRARRPTETYKQTFISDIDGSVQYYGVNPALPNGKNPPPPALFLSLHGAGVEAIGQADAYSSKNWGYLVAPTNRRPYGFDWEDWGRLDALEVLDQARRRFRPDPSRIYLTGHSMGGHGTWQVGVTFPDRFAAIGPSAGWVSFWSYGGASRTQEPTPMEQMLLRAGLPSDTLALSRNTTEYGVYILHGGADDNVPPTEARTMDRELAGFHRDYVYHEEPGQGHWWDLSDEPGADCVDWAPMFDFFARHSLPRDPAVRQVEFTTASPGVSAWSHWAGIEAQTHPLQISSVSLRCDPGQRRFVGTTRNVARLALKLDALKPGAPLSAQIDGDTLEAIDWPGEGDRITLAREGGHWRVAASPSPALKGPGRYGPFKDAFRNRMVFVYGTQGTPEENAWAFAKARYDAETFWVRGNGAVDVLPDTAFDARKERGRSVILYGNAETNGAWQPLLSDSPVQVRRGQAQVGGRTVTGEDLACLFVRPRPGSDAACIGVVSGTGLPGMRLSDRMPYFVAGVAYPDCILLGPETLTEGSSGVRAAGFFGLDWGVDTGEFVWQ